MSETYEDMSHEAIETVPCKEHVVDQVVRPSCDRCGNCRTTQVTICFEAESFTVTDLCDACTDMLVVARASSDVRAEGRPTANGEVRLFIDLVSISESRESQRLILRNASNNRRLTICVDTTEAMAIASAVREPLSTIATTHDAWIATLTALRTRIDSGCLHRFGTHSDFAELRLSRGAESIKVDMRPSDALIVCLKTGAPFLVKAELLPRDGKETKPRTEIPVTFAEDHTISDPSPDNEGGKCRDVLHSRLEDANFDARRAIALLIVMTISAALLAFSTSAFSVWLIRSWLGLPWWIALLVSFVQFTIILRILGGLFVSLAISEVGSTRRSLKELFFIIPSTTRTMLTTMLTWFGVGGTAGALWLAQPCHSGLVALAHWAGATTFPEKPGPRWWGFWCGTFIMMILVKRFQLMLVPAGSRRVQFEMSDSRSVRAELERLGITERLPIADGSQVANLAIKVTFLNFFPRWKGINTTGASPAKAGCDEPR